MQRSPDYMFDMDHDALTTFQRLKTILLKAGRDVRAAHVSGKSMEDGAHMTPGSVHVVLYAPTPLAKRSLHGDRTQPLTATASPQQTCATSTGDDTKKATPTTAARYVVRH